MWDRSLLCFANTNFLSAKNLLTVINLCQKLLQIFCDLGYTVIKFIVYQHNARLAVFVNAAEIHKIHIMPCRLRLTKRNADVGILQLIDPVIKHFNKSVLRRDAVNLREPAILKFFIIDPAAVAFSVCASSSSENGGFLYFSSLRNNSSTFMFSK